MNRNRWIAAGSLLIVASCVGVMAGCAGKKPRPVSTVPEQVMPASVYFGSPQRKYEVLGSVRASKTYPTLSQELTDEQEARLCKRAFFEAARELLKNARENGGDAVVDVHSVIFLADGRRETYDRPECTDDGDEGEALVQGIAVKWSVPAAAPKP